jgi:hypothetical protein
MSLSGSLWWSGQAVHPQELGQDMPVKMLRRSQPVMATDFAGGIRVRQLAHLSSFPIRFHSCPPCAVTLYVLPGLPVRTRWDPFASTDQIPNKIPKQKARAAKS